MKKKFIPIFITSIIALNGCGNQETDVKEIISRHLEATGGESKIAEQETVYSKGEMESGFTGKRSIELWSVNRKGFRADMAKGDTTRSSVVYDQYAWQVTSPGNATPPQKMPDAAWAAMDLDLSGEIAGFEAKGNKAEYTGMDTIDGNACYKIKMTNKAGRTTYYSIDKGSYYVLQSKVFHLEGNKEIDDGTSRFDDYRKTNSGVIVPFLLKQLMDGKVVGTTQFSTVEINKPIDRKIFEMPK